jgi:hypothetical protein
MNRLEDSKKLRFESHYNLYGQNMNNIQKMAIYLIINNCILIGYVHINKIHI